MKIKFHRLSVIGISCILFLLMAPLTSYATTTATFTYNEYLHSLNGNMFTDDYSKVQVRITSEDSVTNVTYEDSLTNLSLGFDDNNSRINYMTFKIDGMDSIPDKIEYSNNGETWIQIPKSVSTNDFTLKDDNLIIDGYRITATENLSTVQASVYAPANTMISTFTPSEDADNESAHVTQLNSIQFDFGADGVLKWNELDASDFTLMDNDTHSHVSISDVHPDMKVDLVLKSKIDSTRAANFILSSDLVLGHTYTLSMTEEADGNEILMPTAGNYDLIVRLGTLISLNFDDFEYEYFVSQNAHYFKQVSITAASSSSEGSGEGGGGNGSGGVGDSGSGIVTLPESPKSDPGELNTTPVRKDIGGVPTDSFAPDKKDVDQAIQELPADNPKLTVHAKMDGDAVQVVLPAESLSQASSSKSDLVVSFDFGDQSYELPVSALNLKDISNGLQADLADITLKVMVVKQTGNAAQNIQQTAESTGSKLLSDALEFTVVAEANGKQSNVNEFGNTYVSRSISLNQEVDKSKLTGVTYDPVKKEFRFVPAIVTLEDGKTVITLKRTGNSIYAVIESNKSFSDIATHWAKNDIQLLASKLIVQGVNEMDFAPERTMTRAEYTALLVRSLGLTPIVEGTATFEDVAAEDWYYGEVEAAVKAGITNGDGSGEFHPDDRLTREQAAVLTAAALKFAGQSEQSKLSATIFKDSDQISNWALHDVNQLQSLQILSGMPNGNFEPQKTLTRAEAVTILKRFLLSAELMN